MTLLSAWFARRRAFETTVLSTLADIRAQVTHLMASESDLQNDLDTIKAGVANVATLLQSQAVTITQLQAQVAAGTPVSQAQLDAMAAEAAGIASSLTALVPPAPAAAPSA